jgi:hypothetical protein
MSNAFIFDGFPSMGGICFFILISKTVGWLPVLLMYYSGVFWNNKFFVELLRELIVEKVWM